MSGLWQDLRYTVRRLRRSPGFTAVAVLTFAIGIGANAAVFSVVDAVLLQPLTYSDSDRLVVLHETVPPIGRVPVGAAEFEFWRDNADSFEQMALMAVSPVIMTGNGEPMHVEGARVSASFFPMLGADPALGRAFGPEAEIAGRDRVVVLSDGLWRSRFGADESIVGRIVHLNDAPYLVTGVLPPHFRFPRLEQIFVMGISGGIPELWMPFAIGDSERTENSFAALGKLKRNVSPDQADAELRLLQHRYVQRIPNPPQLGADVVPLHEQIAGTSRGTLFLLWAAIATVLIIACSNVVNLLLVRAETRRVELAIRSALGATRRALLRQSLTDGLAVAALGGAIGILLASWLLPLLLQLAPASVPRLEEVAINSRVLIFAAVMATATGLLVGLLPVRRVADVNLAVNLRTSERTGTGNRRDRTIRGLLMTAQLALTVACLGTAGLILQSLTNVLRVEPGFDSERVMAVEASMSPGRYPNTEALAAFARKVVQRIEGMPGIESVGVVNRLPLRGISMTTMLVVEGGERAPIPMIERPHADVRSVDAGYFRTLGISLLEGELVDDMEFGRPVAVVSRTMARRAWPGENAIGKRFRLGAQPRRLIEVIGVVEDVRNMGLESNPSLTVYLPYSQFFVYGMSFAMRTTMEPAAVATLVRSAIAEVDGEVPIDSVRSMQSIIGDSVTTRRFQATILIVLGGLAVILAGIGVFGVMAYAVVERLKEFGIRLALGASPRSLQQMMLGNALGLVSIGLALGLPLTLAAGYALRHMLFGVEPANPFVLGAACGLVILIAVVATIIPARRAARVDPLVALRYE